MRLFEQNPGGAPANVLTAVSKLGGETAFIGKIGRDMHGAFLRETLKKHRVEKPTRALIENRGRVHHAGLCRISGKRGEKLFLCEKTRSGYHAHGNRGGL